MEREARILRQAEQAALDRAKYYQQQKCCCIIRIWLFLGTMACLVGITYVAPLVSDRIYQGKYEERRAAAIEERELLAEMGKKIQSSSTIKANFSTVSGPALNGSSSDWPTPNPSHPSPTQYVSNLSTEKNSTTHGPSTSAATPAGFGSTRMTRTTRLESSTAYGRDSTSADGRFSSSDSKATSTDGLTVPSSHDQTAGLTTIETTTSPFGHRTTTTDPINGETSATTLGLGTTTIPRNNDPVGWVRSLDPDGEITDVFSDQSLLSSQSVPAEWSVSQKAQLSVNELCTMVITFSNGTKTSYVRSPKPTTLHMNGIKNAEGSCRPGP